ncbi:MAG: T9SS type A sorting domain-containing protein [Mariniphaga sp.]
MRKFSLLFILTVFTFWSYAQTIHGVSWVNWPAEPDYPDVTGYASQPYNNPEVTVFKAPSSWSPVSDVASFDATWDLLGEENLVANPTNVDGGDLFDLDGDATFGASWKAVHDGANFYLLLKYFDTNGLADATSRKFEIMAQPTSPLRHEPTFAAASDSTADKTFSEKDLVVAYQNMAYARSVELGGGKAVFDNGFVTEYAGSMGVTKRDFKDYYEGNWGANEAGLEAMLDADHFWDETDGVIRAVLVMSLDGALSYPKDPSNLAGERNALKVGETFAFDVKSCAKKDDANVEYFWSADKNNGYASNYYSGLLTLDFGTSTNSLKTPPKTNVYVHDGILYVRGGQPVDLEIYSVLGVRMKTAKNVNKLSIQEMQKGIYLVRVNKELKTTKIVKY